MHNRGLVLLPQNEDMHTKPENNHYDLSAPFLLAQEGTRLIQIQPTLRCNLRCLHCYSESGPDRRGELAPERFERFLDQAYDLGYSYVGVSGGEPLLWKGLEGFLELALHKGYSTSVTTNGTLLTKRNIARLKGRAHLVAVSVDGPPEEHAIIRNSKTAFPAMQLGLMALRRADIPFTIAFTLTRYNAGQLQWLYEFAREEGALGINVHPLSGSGSASTHLLDAVPDSLEFQAASWLLALLVQQYDHAGPAVTMDVIRRKMLEKSCWAALKENAGSALPSSVLVPSLIVEPDGCILPFTYGFPRSWAIGHLDDDSLSATFEQWRTNHADTIAALLTATLDRLAEKRAEYFDLFGELLITARDLQPQFA